MELARVSICTCHIFLAYPHGQRYNLLMLLLLLFYFVCEGAHGSAQCRFFSLFNCNKTVLFIVFAH